MDRTVSRRDATSHGLVPAAIGATNAASHTKDQRHAPQHRIASIPADGIGPEVIAAGLEVLDAVAARDGGFSLMVDHYDWGSD